jgi:hypothetical protein
MSMTTRTLLLLSSVALVSACGAPASSAGSASSTPDVETTAQGIDFARAIALAAPLHPSASPFVVERETEDGRSVIEVKLLEGMSVHVVKLSPTDGSVVEDETRQVEEDDAQEMSALGTELAARQEPLQHGLDLMIAQYGEPALDEVELEMHGAVMVLEAAVMEGGSRSVRVHDPADGHYIMTED